MRKMNKKGFTIVELVIVIAVIAILSAVLIPTFSGVVANAEKAAAKSDAKAALQQYLYDNAETITEETKLEFIYDDGKGNFVAVIDGQVSANVHETAVEAAQEIDATIADDAEITLTRVDYVKDSDPDTDGDQTINGTSKLYTFVVADGE